MSFIFGEGWDLYAAVIDSWAGYWDGGTQSNSLLSAGRLGGRCYVLANGPLVYLIKTSGVNDAVHHISVAFAQTPALTGTTLGSYFQLSDGATNQCCIVFRSDGTILLTSATPVGTVLATYPGAVTAQSVWFQFEFEVIISNTVGRFRVRKNGNPVDDFDSGATLNTRPGTNAYANKLTLGQQVTVSSQNFDDFLWRSDASSLSWLGDIRCYTRMPVSDASAQFTKSIPTSTVTPYALFGAVGNTAGLGWYSSFTVAYDGTIGSLTVSSSAGYTGNMKCSLFASGGGIATTVLGSATPITNPVTGNNTFTFGTPVAVVKGTQYWVGIISDTSSGSENRSGTSGGYSNTLTTYASFPVASPPNVTAINQLTFTYVLTLTQNNNMVSETLQDGLTSYVYDSVPGHADLYTVAAPASTPTSVVAVTTRGFMQKSDSGARTGTVQIKSGGTTVAAPTVSLTTGFQWAWRTDTTDPNAFSFTTWSTTDKSSNQTLSGGNLTATSTSTANGGVRTAIGNIIGKWYWELTFNTNVDPNGLHAGVTILANNISALGVTSTGAVVNGAAGSLWANGSFIGGMPSTTPGLTMCFAMDTSASLVWIRVGAAGQWNGSGTANPTTGTGGLSPAGGGAALYPFYRSQANAEVVVANFGSSAFVGTAPSGFVAGYGTNAAWTAANALAVQIGPTVVS